MILSTPLESRHIALGAKMTEFAGYNMPVLYTNLQEEHHAVRKSVGVFDVSHMGEFIVKGKQALDLVQRISSNNAGSLTIGQAQYACLPNENGGIVDDMIAIIEPIVEIVYERLQRVGRFGRTLTLKVKYKDFTSITRSISFSSEVEELSILVEETEKLVREHIFPGDEVRLLGVTVSNLTEISIYGEQIKIPFPDDLFAD